MGKVTLELSEYQALEQIRETLEDSLNREKELGIKIEQLNSDISKDGFYEFNIWNKISAEIEGRGSTSKEAYIDAINQFLIWYNENR